MEKDYSYCYLLAEVITTCYYIHIGGIHLTFKVIETFSGIGAQAKALERIKKDNPNFDYEIVKTVEWEIGASYAYDLIHHGKQNLKKYDNLKKNDLVNILSNFNLSSDGKQPMTRMGLKHMPIQQLKAILHSIEANKNLVDITSVHAKDLPDADLLTYSFPCQDLSISSYWHGNFSGIDKDAGNRSGLLWEIERILKEYKQIKKAKPRFLLMENVSAIHGPLHSENFNLWIEELREMGYVSFYYDIDASNFGIPQSRVRTFMISILVEDLTAEKVSHINSYFSQAPSTKTHLLHVELKKPRIDDFLRLDYSNEQYRKEAIESTPNFTESRKKIFANSQVLANGNECSDKLAKTITTKQDRNPNAGIIIHNLNLDKQKSPYRNLTPRETFLLMGFDENDFQMLTDNNLAVSENRKFLSHSKLLKLSGNSIVVNILQEIFNELIDLNSTVINPADNVIFSEKFAYKKLKSVHH